MREFNQRGDEPAFDYLASIARYPATVFDVRPLRSLLRRRLPHELSARDASLLYSADSSDAVICYKEVTPSGMPEK